LILEKSTRKIQDPRKLSATVNGKSKFNHTMGYGTYSVIYKKIYETPAEYPAIYGGDECGAGLKGMQSPS
jgi:hypothetical protein